MATCENYTILRKLGTGGFADVFLARNDNDQSICALKVIVKNSGFNEEFEAYIQKEIDTMKDLHHNYILNLVDSNMNAVYKRNTGAAYDVCFMALELAHEGDLFDYILQTNPFSEELVRYYLHQMVEAFDYMNQKGITHRDLKPENLLFDSEFNIKVSDFGWASRQARNTSNAGTLNYMAPEIKMQETYSPYPADIFSLGILLFTMVAKHPPFSMPDTQDKYYKVLVSNRSDLFWKYHTKRKPSGLDYFSESFRDLITQMLQLDPVTRPSLAEIKSHEWFNLPIPSKQEVKEEFKKRKQIIQEEKMRKDQELPEVVVGPEIYQNSIVHRGSEETKEEEAELVFKHLDTIKCDDLYHTTRECEIYHPMFSTLSQFFSSSPVEELFLVLLSSVAKLSTEYEISATCYKVDFKVVKDDIPVNICASVLQTDQEGISCVHFQKSIQGDIFLFNETYKQIKDFFGGHSNAEEPKGKEEI
ncbi:unnamed protein product [Moneuplotes crassus]|uniref:Protein kinase domain-containing protein n=1 Tax=Euplotes crassus TaxID=5936 RepID=A0AAD1UBC7_EUPCR|nr:unnamed protein product [Moneuplotes crassus]